MDEAVPANDKTWCKATSRGRGAMMLMLYDDRRAGQLYDPPVTSIQSIYQGDLRANLANWGYFDRPDLAETFTLNGGFLGGSWRAALDSCDIKTRTGVDHYGYFFQHQDLRLDANNNEKELGTPAQEYTFDGKTYPVGDRYERTAAHIRYAVNPASGVIFVNNMMGPRHAWQDYFEVNRKEPPPLAREDEPDLKRVSDLLWAGWARTATSNLKNINYFMMIWVSNDETMALIKRIIDSHQHAKVPEWPGLSWATKDSEHAQAILGSPNGRSLGMFLAEHKSELGDRYISRITIFKSLPMDEHPMILFHVNDSPQQTTTAASEDIRKAWAPFELDPLTVRGRSPK